MPIIVKCPSCRASLRIPSKVIQRGKDIHCPRCKSPISPYEAIQYNPEPTPPAATAPHLTPSDVPAADDGLGDLVPLFPAEERHAKPRGSSPGRRDKEKKSKPH